MARRKAVTKQGAHGTLYLYEMKYDDGPESCMVPTVWRCWAYDVEHAEERWHETDEDLGFRLLTQPRRVLR